MGAVAGLQHHGHHAGVDLGLFILPPVVDADNVGAGFGDHLQKSRQLAGLVRDLGGEFGEPPRLGQTLGDDPGENGHIDVAAGDQTHGLQVGVDKAEQRGGHAGGAGSFRHGFLGLHQ